MIAQDGEDLDDAAQDEAERRRDRHLALLDALDGTEPDETVSRST